MALFYKPGKKRIKPVSFFNFKPSKSKPNKLFQPKTNSKTKNLIFGFDLAKPSRKVKGKKSLSYKQAKIKFPGLSPHGDADRDGVKNWLDCRPFDPTRQGLYKLPTISKKQHHRRTKEMFPIVVQNKKHGIIEVLKQRGIITYKKVKDEKLADIQRDHPEENYTKENTKESLGGHGGILAKGKTPGKIIFKNSIEKRDDSDDVIYEKDNKYGSMVSEKIKQLNVYDKDSGDVETYNEIASITKKELEDQRINDFEKEYHPMFEEYKLHESGSVTLNPNPEHEIHNKRSDLKYDAKDKSMDSEFIEPTTAEAFKNIIDYDGNDDNDDNDN